MWIDKIETIYWFAKRPRFYAQALELGVRKFRPNRDSLADARQATDWAVCNLMPLAQALSEIGLTGLVPSIDSDLMAEARELAQSSAIPMGGPGDVELLHAVTVMARPNIVIETGVAYGWSTLAVLSGLRKNNAGRLISVDMPYPKKNNDSYVGVAVPDWLRENWTLLKEPDRNGLKKALKLADGLVDLVHYDSDKSYYGRRFAFPKLWNALRSGGIFISDDIQDNYAFAEFVEEKSVKPCVIQSGKKFVGICRKP